MKTKTGKSFAKRKKMLDELIIYYITLKKNLNIEEIITNLLIKKIIYHIIGTINVYYPATKLFVKLSNFNAISVFSLKALLNCITAYSIKIKKGKKTPNITLHLYVEPCRTITKFVHFTKFFVFARLNGLNGRLVNCSSKPRNKR